MIFLVSEILYSRPYIYAHRLTWDGFIGSMGELNEQQEGRQDTSGVAVLEKGDGCRGNWAAVAWWNRRDHIFHSRTS